MKRRWACLFWPGLSTLIGVAWLLHRLQSDLATWWHISLVAMIAGTVVAFMAMVNSYPHKWPAAIVLICVGPLLLELVPAYKVWFEMVVLHPPSLLVLLGPAVTAVAALGILIAKPPEPPPEDPVPRAAVVD